VTSTDITTILGSCETTTNGEPHAAGKPGKSAADECFPPALLYRLDADATISSHPEPNEPIAADFRAGKDGAQNGALKLIAGLLGVGLDELIQRELQAEARRRRRAVRVAGAMAVLAVGALAAGAGALWQRNVARDALERVFAERSWEALRRGEGALAARYALAGWRIAPDSAPVYRAALGAVLHTGLRPLPLRASEADPKDFHALSASFSRDGTRAIAAIWDGTARVWDTASGKEIAILRGHTGKVSLAEFSPDSTRAVTAGEDLTGRVWDVASGRQIANLGPHKDAISHVEFTADGARVISVDQFRARLWDAVSGREILAFPARAAGDLHYAKIGWDFGLSPDGARLVVEDGARGAPRILDVASGKEILKLKGYNGGIVTAAFSTDGTRIVAATWDGVARVWDATTGHQLLAVREQDSCVYWASVTCGSRRIEADELDQCVADFLAARNRYEASGTCLSDFHGIQSAHLSPDGKRILTTSSHDVAGRIWDAETGGRSPPFPSIISPSSVGRVQPGWKAHPHHRRARQRRARLGCRQAGEYDVPSQVQPRWETRADELIPGARLGHPERSGAGPRAARAGHPAEPGRQAHPHRCGEERGAPVGRRERGQGNGSRSLRPIAMSSRRWRARWSPGSTRSGKRRTPRCALLQRART
jgi:WD40 repeat protein